MPKPFIGIPFLNRPDLLGEVIEAFEGDNHVFVVNNNSVDAEINQYFSDLTQQFGLDSYSARTNLGVAASWNRIVMRAIGLGYEYIYIGSNDTVLNDGVLQEFVEMEKSETDCLWKLNHFNFFCLHKRFIDRVGWFDENFYPAYYEDNDFVYRCVLAGLGVVDAPPEMLAKTHHKVSQTINSDPVYAAGNRHTFNQWNATHYRMKWGGMPGAEKFTTPYGKPNHDHRWWGDPQGSIAHRDWDKDRGRIR